MFHEKAPELRPTHSPCARCGTATPSLVELLGHRVCPACVADWHEGVAKLELPPQPLLRQPWRPDGVAQEEYGKALREALAAQTAVLAHWTAEWLKAGKERAA